MIESRAKLLLVATLMSAVAILSFAAGCSTRSWKTSPEPALNGIIQTVDVTNHLLTVASQKSGSASLVFHWDSDTRFWASGGLSIEPRLLEPQDSVRIHYQVTPSGWRILHLYLSTYRTVH